MNWVLNFHRTHRPSYVVWALFVAGLDLLSLTRGPMVIALAAADSALLIYLVEARAASRALRALTRALKEAELLFFGVNPVSFRLELREAAPYFSDSVLNRQVALFIENIVGFSHRPLTSSITPDAIQVIAEAPSNLAH